MNNVTYTLLTILFFTLLPLKKGNTQNNYQIILDKDFSHVAGAHNMVFLHKLLTNFQEKHIPNKFNDESTFLKKGLGISYRLSKLFLFDFQQDYLITLTNHEAFGHGSRFREYGFEGNALSIALFQPFGHGGGFFTPGNTPANYTLQKEIVGDNIGGVESNVVLADILMSNMLLQDSLHYRESLLYFLTNFDQLFYILSDHLRDGKGGDMRGYVSKLNDEYALGNEVYTTDKLAQQSLITLANPVNLYGIYTVFYKYLVKGESGIGKIPMFAFGKYRYLPNFNINHTPFGTQYVWSNLVRVNNKLLQADFGLSDKTFNDGYHLKLRYYNAVQSKKFKLNFYSEVWSQPELELTTNTATTGKTYLGGLVKSDVSYKVSSNEKDFNLFMQLGYKTAGFTIGEPLDKSLLLRAGLGFNL